MRIINLNGDLENLFLYKIFFTNLNNNVTHGENKNKF